MPPKMSTSSPREPPKMGSHMAKQTSGCLAGACPHSECPCTREAGGSESVTEDGMMKARSWNDASERPQDKEHSSLWKPEKAQKQILPQPPKGPAL